MGGVNIQYKTMIIIVLTIFLFGIASTCASDVNDMPISSEDATPIELTQSDSIIVDNTKVVGQPHDEKIITEENVATFQELQDNISANYGSTLTLDRNYEYEDGFNTEGIEIAQSITIDGQGHKIDAKGKSRIFNILSNNVTMKNITFVNGNHIYNAGAINLYSNDSSISDCIFVNNTARYGGSIYGQGNNNKILAVFL